MGAAVGAVLIDRSVRRQPPQSRSPALEVEAAPAALNREALAATATVRNQEALGPQATTTSAAALHQAIFCIEEGEMKRAISSSCSAMKFSQLTGVSHQEWRTEATEVAPWEATVATAAMEAAAPARIARPTDAAALAPIARPRHCLVDVLRLQCQPQCRYWAVARWAATVGHPTHLQVS